LFHPFVMLLYVWSRFQIESLCISYGSPCLNLAVFIIIIIILHYDLIIVVFTRMPIIDIALACGIYS